MIPDDTPDPRAAKMKDPRQLKTGDRVVYRETGTDVDIYPTVTQVLAHPDRVTVKLGHPSWPTYRFVDCGRTVITIPPEAGTES
jgi:hypothetical protein